MLPTIKIKQLLKTDKNLINEVRLLAAERNFPSLANFNFDDSTAAWILLNSDNQPTNFACAHSITINDQVYVRIMSKAAQLSDQRLPLLGITGRAKRAENYCMLFHHINWANTHYPNIPIVITASVDYNKDSPKSHLVFKLCKSGKYFGVNPDYFLTNVNKKVQGVFGVQSVKVFEAYSQLEKMYKVVVE